MDKDRVQGKAKRAEGPLKEAEGTIVGVRTWRETASSRTPSVRFSPVTGFQIKHKEIKVTGMEITRTTKEETMKKRIVNINRAGQALASLISPTQE